MTESEALRQARFAELNSESGPRRELEEKYGQVWDTTELSRDFEVRAFAAPFVIVKRRADGVSGSLEFQHSPRFYFNWRPER